HALPPPRDEGLPQALPSRLHRSLPRTTVGGRVVVPPRARAEPALLDPLGAGRPERSDTVRKLLLLGVVAVSLLAPVAAQAHPLGNFTINRFARVEVAGHRLYVRYVLDLAEIPTYQARRAGVDPNVYARRIARGLHVALAGSRVTLAPGSHALAFPA